MAYTSGSLISFGTGGSISGDDTQRRAKIWHYHTNDTIAAVAGAGYFNADNALLQAGDVIFVSADMDGTPAGEIYLIDGIASGVVSLTEFTDATS